MYNDETKCAMFKLRTILQIKFGFSISPGYGGLVESVSRRKLETRKKGNIFLNGKNTPGQEDAMSSKSEK
ncbi:hypothetical protein AVEN_238398-1 [Araneus ventricosus]|uniref:Uncharacterized protein n=1 Tax=Araneus ventricosus TaxID=182803 RepID=A0A4Y2DQW6_ARAVE|nr:hypothetical protein AVEN_238398-1 [Araneus ventricosus]